MPDIVISNTSPIFYLSKLCLLDVLTKLYKEILIPEAVVNELNEGKRIGLEIPVIEEIKGFRVKKVSIPSFLGIDT